MLTPSSVPDTDMPQLFRAADIASLHAQRLYVELTRWRLILLGTAAMAGVASWRVGAGEIDVLAVIGVGLFIAALLLETWLWRSRPDKAWYDGRAVAESAKTLAWKFAVAGGPFPATMPLMEAKRTLLTRLDDIHRQFPDLELAALNAPSISEWMVATRQEPLEVRKAFYLNARIRDQKRWYTTKAGYNKRRSKQWKAVTVSLEMMGAIAFLAEALVDTGLSFAPALAALAGAVVAWIGSKQHETLARAYGAAVTDLASAEGKLDLITTEAEWASEVDDAEEAISREHTVWLATRSKP